jgi:hypothetical protein
MSRNPYQTSIDYPIIKNSDGIENILCLSALIAIGRLNPNSTLQDAEDYYNTLMPGCSNCSLESVCLACIINQ